MAKLYANENFPRQVVDALRELGHDVRTTHEAGKSEQEIPDEAVLEFAQSQSRAVVTLNRQDFIRLHRRLPDHCGIIVCTFDSQFTQQAKRIHDAIALEEALEGKLIRVNRPG